MKLLLLLLLHLALVSARLFAHSGLQAAYNNKGHAPQSLGSANGRQRPLFARRGQYERQSLPSRAVYASSRGLPAPPRIAPPPKAAPKPVKPTCSLLAQSCLPQSGCCEPHTTCHCRFFNAICFCRKTILQYEKKS
ncbi:agouti-signaling protein-like [Cynoglossus semilaevis]|uniref:agouti-signaling protein-like n=1 Tax=Cynoglossus semilaevis TaxID=244447 RepID=UPI000496C6C3|nr:agouti-signaling protein-like [Cynoglossus semilaevis]